MAVRKRTSLLVFVALVAVASSLCASAFDLSRPDAGLNGRKFLFESAEPIPTPTFLSTGAAQTVKSRPTHTHFSTLAAQEERATLSAGYAPLRPLPPIHYLPPPAAAYSKISAVNINTHTGFNRGGAVFHNGVIVRSGFPSIDEGEKRLCTGGKHCPFPSPAASFEEIVSKGPFEEMFPVPGGHHIHKGFNRGGAVLHNGGIVRSGPSIDAALPFTDGEKRLCADGKHCPFPTPAAAFEEIVGKGPFEEMFPVPKGDHINEGFNRGGAVLHNSVLASSGP